MAQNNLEYAFKIKKISQEHLGQLQLFYISLAVMESNGNYAQLLNNRKQVYP